MDGELRETKMDPRDPYCSLKITSTIIHRQCVQSLDGAQKSKLDDQNFFPSSLISWSHFNFFFELDSETTNFICIQKDQVSIISRILRWLKNVRARKKKWQWRSFHQRYIITCLTCFIIVYYYFTGIVWKVL